MTKNSYRELVKEAQAAKRESAAKSDFLSHMSHDIRTPLNGIMGMTDMAIKNIDDTDKVLDCLNKIAFSSRHLFSLVNDILDMTRIEQGKLNVLMQPMNMEAVVNQCIAILEGLLTNRNIFFSKKFSSIKHKHVLGDELHVCQILNNILGNAVKFTPDGGLITFELQERALDEDTVEYKYIISDSGIGMSRGFVEKIFDVYAQENEADRSDYKGVGLGMPIAKELVLALGGDIQLDSTKGKGTTFVVTLNFKLDKEATTKSVHKEPEISLTGRKVLIAEDNDLNREIATYFLEEAGLSVRAAANGRELVDIFAESKTGEYDAILMDIMMPVMDGFMATKEIRAMYHPDAVTIPIIAMTANAFREDKIKALEAGMNDHISKPFDLKEMITTISKHMSK